MTWLGLLLAWTALVYSNIFRSGFHYDDFEAIVFNPAVKDPWDFYTLLAAFNTRFLTGWTFALNYAGGCLDPFGYHVVNVLIHLICTALVFFLSEVTFLTPQMRAQTPEHHRRISLGAAMLFALHPVQIQTVAYIWQRATSLATLFYITAILFYAYARLRHSGRLLALAWLSAGLAMFSKEISMTIPFAIVLYEICFFGFSRKWENGRWWLPFFLLLPVIPWALRRAPYLTLILMRPLGISKENTWDITRWMPGNRYTYFFTQLKVIRTYLRLFFWPAHQNLEYQYPCSYSLDRPALMSAILILTLMFAAWRLRNKARVVCFGVFFFFLALSVESLVVMGVIYEHRMYLPMVGLAVAFSNGAWTLLRRRRIYLFCFCLIALLASILTYRRNFVWKDERTLWEDVVRKSPGNYRAHHTLGLYYKKQRHLEDAVKEFNRTLTINPKSDVAWNDLGNTEFDLRHWDKAVDCYKKAIEQHEYEPLFHNNLGVVYFRLGRKDEAFLEFHKALRCDPLYEEAKLNLEKMKKNDGVLAPQSREEDV